MNRGRIERSYRQHRRGTTKATDLCLRCFEFGHRRSSCRNDPLVACGNCFRSYYFSTECPCNQASENGMSLRLVGGESYPRPCIDVKISQNSYSALINLSTTHTKINKKVLDHINYVQNTLNLPVFSSEDLIRYPIKRRQKEVLVDLVVEENQTDPVVLGMEFLMKTNFDFALDKVAINERSPIIRCPNTVDFLYNLPQGEFLKSWMQEKDKPMYHQYTKGENAKLQEEPIVIIENDYQQDHHDEQKIASDSDILDLHTDTDDLDIL
ncbi:hypothetical protein ACFFRR_001368 [Megaselia abdita]